MWHGVIEAMAMLAAAALIWTLARFRTVPVSSGRKRAPQVPGLPLIGNTLGLARHGASFIHKCRLQYGDAFRLSLAGRNMTFLFHPEALRQFFAAPTDEIAFRPAVAHFTQRVFMLPSEQFFPKHTLMLSTLRKALVPAELAQHMQRLAVLISQRLEGKLYGTGKVGLLETIKNLVFEPTVKMLYGGAFVAAQDMVRLQQAFFDFEAGFELAASPVPHTLQRSFCSARTHLLTVFRESFTAGQLEGTVIGSLIRECDMDASLAPHVMLAVMWAALANTVPAAFWSVAFLLLPEHAQHRHRCLEALPAKPDIQAYIEVALDRDSHMARCVAEAVRLRAPGIDMRMAAAELALPCGPGRVVRVHKGELLAISPYESHRDERLFGPGAARFDPDRQALHGVDGVAGIGGLSGFAFGGGLYRCPGRFLAEAEVALIALLLLSRYRPELRPAESTPDSGEDVICHGASRAKPRLSAKQQEHRGMGRSISRPEQCKLLEIRGRSARQLCPRQASKAQ
ncbi:g8766 [Coccomyxa viridis]|uniref:G8766 protein n=1 Tax=Coccomyxa viridis TaxID=1274662 RepID=A0ABP1G168_9CHLO